MNNDLRKIFCSWNSKLEELADYFQDKYNFDIDDDDVETVKETIMEIANDIPEAVSISLYNKDKTKDKKIIAEGSLQSRYRLRIFVNDEQAAHEIIREMDALSEKYNLVPINKYDIEAIVANVTKNKKFNLDCDFIEFDKSEIYRVCLNSTPDGYEIIFPEKPLK